MNPNGLATNGWFEWGTSPTLATFSSTPSQSLGSGTTSQAVAATLSGLTSGTTYYFRVAASNSAGPSKGSIASFSTTAAAVAPTVVTNPATSVTTTGGVLNGGVNPNGLATNGWFEWGTNPTLATFSSTSSQSLGSGTTSQAVAATLSGLTPGTTYYFRVAASNSAGPSKGSIASFSSGRPGRFSAGRYRPGFHGSGALSIHYSVGRLRMDARWNSGYSGTGALQALPDNDSESIGGGRRVRGWITRCNLRVRARTTCGSGRWGIPVASDSLYVGLDGGTSGRGVHGRAGR